MKKRKIKFKLEISEDIVINGYSTKNVIKTKEMIVSMDSDNCDGHFNHITQILEATLKQLEK